MAEPTVQEQLNAALQHHQAGRLQQAEVVYRRVLAQYPDQPDALHWLGILARQVGRNDAALGLIGRAVHLAPTVPAYQHNYGEMWLAAGEPAQAAIAFRKAMQLPGGQPESHVGLGVALQRLKQFAAAADAFQRAIALGVTRPQVYQHLAVALLDAQRYGEAEQACRRALSQGVTSAEVFQTLGEALGKQNRLDEAIGAFRRATEIQPNFARPYNGIGVALSMQKRFDEAAGQFHTAIRLKGDYSQAHFNLGVVFLRQQRHEEAIPNLRRALELDPNYLEARAQLAESLDRVGRRAEAVAELETLAKLQPGNPEIEFALAALSGREAPAQPPAITITNLFERYADVFDKHLSENLRYRAPQVLFEAVTAAGPPPKPNVMDLGCGTGLCGQLFRPTAATLTGVDLSPGMIAKARARGIYDHLEVGDLTAALRSNPNRFEVVVAADVFVYLGDLSETFAAAHASLKPGGLFGFSVESIEEGTYVLHPSRRYAHSPQYVRDLAGKAGFEVVSMDRAPLRTESQKDVLGLVTVLRTPGGTGS